MAEIVELRAGEFAEMAAVIGHAKPGDHLRTHWNGAVWELVERPYPDWCTWRHLACGRDVSTPTWGRPPVPASCPMCPASSA